MTIGVGSGGTTSVANSIAYGVTVANNGGTPNRFGYAPGEVTNPGAISPITTFRGVSIVQLNANNTSFDFLVSLTGSVAQTLWRSLVVQQTDGSWRRYLSANATFSAGVVTNWQFGSGSSPVWTSTTSPRGIIFFI